MFSIGELKHDPSSFFGDIIWTDKIKLFVWLLVLGGCWWISFILSMGIFTISAMAASWYFDQSNNGVNFLVAYCWGYTYHIGTLAFGSLIIAILWVIQIVLEYVYQKLKNTNSSVQFIIKCA